MTTHAHPADYDVVIIGAGLAGLSLARQLLLRSATLRILHLEKRVQVPQAGIKVGEATVQVSGYYFSKVLELEEHLMREHFLKYNLRFFWPTAGSDPAQVETYSQSYIRKMSNVPSYQIARLPFERELLRVNLERAEQYTLVTHALDVAVHLSTDGPAGAPHRVTWKKDGVTEGATATWVVDAAGRAHVLQKGLGLTKPNTIRHGSSFLWVDGLVNVEQLTDMTPDQIRLNPQRSQTGHLPFWLATNHFCGEGFWFWVIPLHGATSLGLVYDTERVRPEDVNDPRKLVAWICERFPLFQRDLPARTLLHHGSFRSHSHDAVRTIDRNRWAMVGEAGRFTDPLYSPGGDLIAIYNTLVTDAILTGDPNELDAKVAMFEQLEQAVYSAYVPSFTVSYDCLGDQEVHSLKYVWELTIYFAFYVFPFINDLFTDRRFIIAFLRAFGRLGRVNLSLQTFLKGYYDWKKTSREPQASPVFFDFYEVQALSVAESTFYKVGVSIDEARLTLEMQLDNTTMLARYIAAHVYAMVLHEPAAVTNRAFIESLDVARLEFEPAAMCAHYATYAGLTTAYPWPAGWNPEAAFVFRTASRAGQQETAAMAAVG
ncbi:MAG: hypothetical protein ABL982_02565 [Vicinamibacterales bacterium]